MKQDNKISKFIVLPDTDFPGDVGDFTKPYHVVREYR